MSDLFELLASRARERPDGPLLHRGGTSVSNRDAFDDASTLAATLRRGETVAAAVEDPHELHRWIWASRAARCPLALLPAVRDYALPQAEFLMLIEGMEMDAEGPIVAPTMSELRGYTRRVAGAVGLISMRIFGAWRGALSARFALALADALQLTNILRDVAEDTMRGRLYLPAEMLARHNIAPDPATVLQAPALPDLLGEIGQLA
ncbi:MAG: squalene/phytoene synthase family protein, partial [Acidobacteriota bacterium]